MVVQLIPKPALCNEDTTLQINLLSCKVLCDFSNTEVQPTSLACPLGCFGCGHSWVKTVACWMRFLQVCNYQRPDCRNMGLGSTCASCRKQTWGRSCQVVLWRTLQDAQKQMLPFGAATLDLLRSGLTPQSARLTSLSDQIGHRDQVQL